MQVPIVDWVGPSRLIQRDQMSVRHESRIKSLQLSRARAALMEARRRSEPRLRFGLGKSGSPAFLPFRNQNLMTLCNGLSAPFITSRTP